jgi:hypothetical protein
LRQQLFLRVQVVLECGGDIGASVRTAATALSGAAKNADFVIPAKRSASRDR